MVTTGPEVKSEGKKVPFYRDPRNIGRAIDFITPDRTLKVLQSLFQYQEEPGFEQDTIHYLKQGYWPVGIFSHFVLADGIALTIAANRLTSLSQKVEDPSKYLTDCYALHQGTMEDGSQGANVQTFTLGLEQAIQRIGMIYLPTITREHVERYGLNPEKVARINADSTEKMKTAPDENKGFLLLPAANMEAARLNGEGKRKGMQQSNLNWIFQMANYTIKGVKILFVPGVITDSFNISDPDKRDFTDEAYQALARNLAVDLLPLGLGRPLQAKLASLTMLRPYPIDRLAHDLTKLTGRVIPKEDMRKLGLVMNSNKALTDQLIMGIIRDQMPNHLSGTYYQGYSSFGLGDYTKT